jgi:hypothetical protein
MAVRAINHAVLSSRTPTPREPSAAHFKLSSIVGISVDLRGWSRGAHGGVQCNTGQEAAHLCQIDQLPHDLAGHGPGHSLSQGSSAHLHVRRGDG